MALSIRIVDSPKGETVTKWNVVFPKEGGKIGRRLDSTMVLNDSKRIISGIHAEIVFASSCYRITDLSINGLYVNRSKTPLGKNKSIGINDGDLLTIGGYTLLVSIDEDIINSKDKALNNVQEEIFDPFKEKSNEQNERETKKVSLSEDSSNLVFPDPFLNLKKSEDDPFVTATSYDLNNRSITDIELTPLDDILDETKEFEIRKDPFSNELKPEKSIHPRTPKPLYLDGRNMFGDNPFNRNNDLIDTPLGDISESSLNDLSYIGIGMAVKRQQSLMEEALVMAMDRFLQEISPEHFEEIYRIFNRSRFFFIKPNYWNSYSEYFKTNIDNKEWQNKFIMYFRECFDIVKNRNQKKSYLENTDKGL
ncbi:MAG: type VI secretion system-associated FHA domain protein [Succinivibrionaceae bacterium]